MSKRITVALAFLLVLAVVLPACGDKEVEMQVSEEEAQQRMEEINKMMEKLPPEQRERMEAVQKRTQEMMQINNPGAQQAEE